MNRAERWIVIALIAIATVFIGQVAINTMPAPEQPPCSLAPTDHGTIECKEN